MRGFTTCLLFFMVIFCENLIEIQADDGEDGPPGGRAAALLEETPFILFGLSEQGGDDGASASNIIDEDEKFRLSQEQLMKELIEGKAEKEQKLEEASKPVSVETEVELKLKALATHQEKVPTTTQHHHQPALQQQSSGQELGTEEIEEAKPEADERKEDNLAELELEALSKLDAIKKKKILYNQVPPSFTKKVNEVEELEMFHERPLNDMSLSSNSLVVTFTNLAKDFKLPQKFLLKMIQFLSDG